MIGNFEVIAMFLIGLVTIVLPTVVLVMLFLIYSKLNSIEKLLSRKD
jgi:hypothetical protein